MRYYLITWRAPGGMALFFRGDGRRKLYLPQPHISDVQTSGSWVRSDTHARLFDKFVALDDGVFGKGFVQSRVKVYEYAGPLLKTHLYIPSRLPPKYNKTPPL
jgi:hypothetical protein